jgi:hypothetical protein
MTKQEHQQLIATGILGLIAALVVGAGEFLLHFDPLARFSSDTYQFMLAGSEQRQTLGHFLGVLGAPLYVAGCWHIYLMLKPANQKWAFVAFLVGAYGFMIGADWISSRASIGAIVHLQQEVPAVDSLIALYDLRYESLLSVVRITTLVLSLIFVVLTLSGRSHYAKWHALFNPIVLLLASFAIYMLAPDVGKYLMPIALNVAFGIFFLLSILQVRSIKKA